MLGSANEAATHPPGPQTHGGIGSTQHLPTATPPLPMPRDAKINAGLDCSMSCNGDWSNTGTFGLVCRQFHSDMAMGMRRRLLTSPMATASSARPGPLSGWHCIAMSLYARLISASVALDDTPKIA